MKRVLVITYYWPPSGGSGVQRWLKFVKYLREFGYEPVVYTPLNPEMMAEDSTLLAEIPEGVEVIKREIIEPYSLYKLFTGKRGTKVKPGFINSGGSDKSRAGLNERISLFLRSNLFVPDPKMLWIFPSVRFLKKYISNNKIDAIVSTGPPHSMHLIAKRLSNSLNIPWLADFRDPWTKMYNFKYMNHTSAILKMHKMLEKRVLCSADAVVTVTPTIAAELSEISHRRVEVVTNGFDRKDFENIEKIEDSHFSLTYTGLFVKSQNPHMLWRVLADLSQKREEFKKDLKIRLIGNTDKSIIDDIEINGLVDNLSLVNYIPHDQIVRWQVSAKVLLLCGGKEPESAGILTGKFFEYLAAGIPILGFGPKGGDMDLALDESGAGEMFDYNEYKAVYEWVEREYLRFVNGEQATVISKIDKYDRRELTKSISSILNRITSKEIL